MPSIRLALAAALAVCASASGAASFSIGTLPVAPSFYSNVASVAPGAFSDSYGFVFPAAGGTASASVASLTVGNVLAIDGLQVSLRDAANTLLASGTASGGSSFVFDVPLIAGASYAYEVTGVASGSGGGTYAFLASAGPIPEPGAYAMLAAGLGIVGFVVARRRPV